jgi:hypothetical protein
LEARAAKEEAARLAARQKSAENRVTQVKSMLAYTRALFFDSIFSLTTSMFAISRSSSSHRANSS